MVAKYCLLPVMAPRRANPGGTMKRASSHHHSVRPAGVFATNPSNELFGVRRTMFGGVGSAM